MENNNRLMPHIRRTTHITTKSGPQRALRGREKKKNGVEEPIYVPYKQQEIYGQQVQAA